MQITQRFHAIGYTGVLNIRIHDGYVNGTYTPDTGGSPTFVTGGTKGSRIWLDLHTLGGIHVEAHTDGDRLLGLGTSLEPRMGRMRSWTFTATPLTTGDPPR